MTPSMTNTRAIHTAEDQAHPILTLSGIKKSFGGVRALVNGELQLFPGSVTALIGENGAGKSTLVKILTGVYQPDGGEICIDGKPVHIPSPTVAQQLGISVIHQESVVFDALSVAENIFITGRPIKNGFVDWKTMRRRSRELLEKLETPIDPDTLVGDLSIAQKHMVQIARALSHDSRVVIMDEPTAALSHHEADELFRIVRQLQNEGRALLFISHKFEEIFSIADRYAVFRDGAAIGHGMLCDTDTNKLIDMMVGRSVEQIFPKVSVDIGAEVLRVENFSRAPEFRDINFSVRRGEILGIYGLVGAGRSEVMQALFGLNPIDSGAIYIDGKLTRIRNPEEAIRHGIALVPEDRQHQGAVLTLPIADNVSLPSLKQLSKFGFLKRVSEYIRAEDLLERLQIKSSGLQQHVRELSGGNQQKVVLAKWLGVNPRVLILDEPTKGIDVGAKSAVHQIMSECVQRGCAIIMVSSELPEVLGMADRVLVMNRGRVCALLDRAEATPENVVRVAADA